MNIEAVLNVIVLTLFALCHILCDFVRLFEMLKNEYVESWIGQAKVIHSQLIRPKQGIGIDAWLKLKPRGSGRAEPLQRLSASAKRRKRLKSIARFSPSRRQAHGKPASALALSPRSEQRRAAQRKRVAHARRERARHSGMGK